MARSVPEAHREYLQTIFALEESGVEPIQARIADWLGVSRASVSEMVRKLGTEGMVTAGRDSVIRLTADGRAVAEALARAGADLVLHGRSPRKCEAAQREIADATGRKPDVLLCDLASRQEVDRAAETFLASGRPLHECLVICAPMSLSSASDK